MASSDLVGGLGKACVSAGGTAKSASRRVVTLRRWGPRAVGLVVSRLVPDPLRPRSELLDVPLGPGAHAAADPARGARLGRVAVHGRAAPSSDEVVRQRQVLSGPTSHWPPTRGRLDA